MSATGVGHLAEVLSRLGIGAFRIDHESGRILEANDAFAAIFGFPSAEAVLGATAMDHYTDPSERAEAAARIYGHPDLKARGSVRFEARRKRLDGEPVDVLFSMVPVLAPDGKVLVADGLVEDIGERKSIEKAFRAGNERFRTLFETNSVGMALATPSCELARVNQALCRFLDRSEEELRGASLLSFVHADDRVAAEALTAESSAGDGGPCVAEWRFVTGSGETRWAHLGSSWLVEDGVNHSRVLIVQDVTRHKEVERALARLEKLEAVGLLAGGIAHDFNNILTAILANVTLAASLPEVGGRAKGLLSRAEQAVYRARELTQQLITFAKGGHPLRKAASMAEIARETAGFCLAGSRCALELTAVPDLLDSEVDVGQMGRVFQNLLLNASEAMQGGGTIRVQLDNIALGASAHPVLAPGRYVRVAVTDQGPGIPPEALPRVFDAYFSTKGRGGGLGLATVASILRAHSGDIDVTSTPGKGATFTLYVPACERGRAEAPSAAARAPRSESGRARILVMDDESALRDVVREILRASGFEVASTSDGAEAVAAYVEACKLGRPYDVVILDLTVPGGVGGLEALRQLKAADPSVCALVSSGYSMDAAMSDFRAHGFVGAVPKPFTAEDLTRAVSDALATRDG